VATFSTARRCRAVRLSRSHRENGRQRALGVGEGIGGALAGPGGSALRTPLGCGEEVGDAHVDTGHRTGRGERFGGHLVTGEDDVALPAPALDADRLDPAL
jgi:hypothetical protein